MKIVKLIGFLLLLSSCNQYLGTVEPDYIPKNEVEEVFLNKTLTLESNDEFKIGKVLYPDNCLLYTSPSPRDLSTSRMPSSA